MTIIAARRDRARRAISIASTPSRRTGADLTFAALARRASRTSCLSAHARDTFRSCSYVGGEMYSSPMGSGSEGLRTWNTRSALPLAFANLTASANAGREAAEKSVGCTMGRAAIASVSAGRLAGPYRATSCGAGRSTSSPSGDSVTRRTRVGPISAIGRVKSTWSAASACCGIIATRASRGS